MVDNVKLGLGKADGSMDSGFRLVGYKWIFAEGSFVSHDIEPTWDLDDISWVVDKSMSGERLGCLLIQCSPFMAKNGRLLFEGDMITFDHSIQTIKAITYCGVIVYERYKWNLIAKGKMWDGWDGTELGYIYDYFNGNLEYTGSIYLKDGE